MPKRRNPEDRTYVLGTLMWAISTPRVELVVRMSNGAKVTALADTLDDLRGVQRGKDKVLIVREQDRGEWIWRLVTSEGLAAMAEPIIEDMANASAAQAWSMPTDDDESEFESVHIVAYFGDRVAVNGDLVPQDQEPPKIPGEFRLTNRGGDVPVTEEEVSLGDVAKELAYQLDLKGDADYLFKLLVGPGKEYAYISVSGETEFYGKPKVKENPMAKRRRGRNAQMKLFPPFVITARLLPGVKIGKDSFISIEFAGETSDGRARYQYHIDTPKWSHSAKDLKSGVGGGSLEDGMESLLSFLGAAAEAYRYDMGRRGQKSENSDLFPKKVNEWAYQNSDEISTLEVEIQEHGEQPYEAMNPPDDEDDFDLQAEMQDGYVIGDARGGGYSVSYHGRAIARPFVELDEALAFVVGKMELEKFWPNVFYVNDHGNVDLLTLKPKVVKGKLVKVESKIVRSWV